jgi:2-polyprenyl-3-methyl-5-hydroxy-6-metoxy-1,4-benzoquinol methylase
MEQSAEKEIASGDRFGFGENWSLFLNLLNDERIQQAQDSLVQMLGYESLEGKRFLDIGSGSGLFSLVARRLGAHVYSFDFDPKSVACTNELRNRYYKNDSQWQIEQGSALDADFLRKFRDIDIVYSWGVLHHTGDMWKALDNVASIVGTNGKLFISIYNDQGTLSKIWLFFKNIYNRLPSFLRLPYALLVMMPREMLTFAVMIVQGRGLAYLRSWTNTQQGRGMDRWRDIIDWIGGYPFEVAKPEAIFNFFKEKDFNLEKLRTCGGHLGCNEFVFQKLNTGTKLQKNHSG